MTYEAMYKCRLCGETFTGEQLPEGVGKETFSTVIKKGRKFYYHAMPKSIIHDCPDGSIGNADFLGFKRED